MNNRSFIVTIQLSPVIRCCFFNVQNLIQLPIDRKRKPFDDSIHDGDSQRSDS